MQQYLKTDGRAKDGFTNLGELPSEALLMGIVREPQRSKRRYKEQRERADKPLSR